MAVLVGTDGPDTIRGTGQADDIQALAGNDTVDGRGGGDFIFGQRGRDLLEGGGGDDDISGGNSADQLRGQNGDDTLRGGSGNDSLSGGKGDDDLFGDKGADQFNFNVNNTSDAGFDIIFDFEDGADLINLGDFGSFKDLDTNNDGKLNNQDDFVTKQGNTTTIDVGAAFGFAAGNELLGVVSSNNQALTADDFVFLA